MERQNNIERLIQTLGDDDELVIVQASELLEELGEPAVDPLIDALNNPNKNIRRYSAHVLGEIGDEKAIEPLIQSLSDDNKWVRRETSGALSKMGDPATQPLIKLLDNPDWKIRGGAAWALGRIGNKKAVEPLIKSLQDESGFVRSGAAWALGTIHDERALEPLTKARNDKSSYVRRTAEKFLDNWGN
jgi:bilin biosynthesis protein